ncbi:PrpF domain-containing protein [Pseudomonas alkylphenolica]|uniref:PrpF domain-containing protein n=1 Tax=Pseudomonas alkylphenolica TaxID=237609 RepID=UPI000949B610|nr:PrpF domain-containing protein [Pseudomonas alkylphenolica]
MRIFVESIWRIAIGQVPTSDGAASYSGQARIDGLPGCGTPLVVQFKHIAGSSCGAFRRPAWLSRR